VALLVLSGFLASSPATAQQTDSDQTAVRIRVEPDTTVATPPVEVKFDAEVGLLSFENLDGDRERFLSAVLLPSFRRGLWQGGARLKVRMNGGGIRREDYDSFADILSIARYIQYAEKPLGQEPGVARFGRLGELEEVRLGYGQVVGEYRNTISFDYPKVGIEGSFGTEKALVEGLLSSITHPELFGARGAYWPFLEKSGSRFREALVGATIAGDLSTDGRLVNELAPGVPYVMKGEGNAVASVVPGTSDGALVIVSVDAGMPIRTAQTERLLAYAELAKIIGFGSGLAVGLNGTRAQEDLRMEGWFEMRLIGKRYIPNYFNSLYEIERVQSAGVSDELGLTAFNSKRNALAGQDKVQFGTFIAFEASQRRRYRIRASFEEVWNKENGGWFHIDFRLRDRNLPYELRFMFDRINVGGLEDIWSGPSRNGIVRLELAYQFWEKLLLGFRIRQSFEPVEELGRLVGQTKQTRIEPNVVLRL
jgi:hypothetical protein